MSDHLFGSITLPPELDLLVDFHRLHAGRGLGSASLVDGWRALLRHELDSGPMAFLSSASEHLEHFGAQVSDAVDELIDTPWSEVVALGATIQSLWAAPLDDRHARSPLPDWLREIENRRVVQASVRDESLHDVPPHG